MSVSGPGAGDGTTGTLARAASVLRAHVDDRWVEVGDSLVARALSASRPSQPVRGATAAGLFAISEQVLVSYLRDSLDAVPDCQVSRIVLDCDAEEGCTGVVVELVVRFGSPLIPLADRIRERAEGRLRELLGPYAPPARLTEMHVHVSDVTLHDPAL